LANQNYLEIQKNINSYLVFGLYPEVLNNSKNSIEIIKNLTNSYLYKDILALARIKKPYLLEKILTALAWQIGNEVSVSELSKHVGADVKTIESYIYLLEETFVIFKLGAFSRNLRNEVNKKKKIFFFDNGIRNALISNFNAIQNRNDIGGLWENFIIMERKKLLSYNGFCGKKYFWRNTEKVEIDYIEEINGELYIFEIKWNPKEKVKFSSTFLNEYKPKSKQVVHRENFMEFVTHYPY
jgi:uncharacterized protein